MGATACRIDPASSAALIEIKAPQILKTGLDRALQPDTPLADMLAVENSQ